MKNDIIWIGAVVVLLGLAIAGGLLFLGGGSRAASVEPPPGATVSAGPGAVASGDPKAEMREAPGPADGATAAAPADLTLASLSPTLPTLQTAPTTSADVPPVEGTSTPAGLVAIEKLIKSGAEFEGRIVTVKGKVLTQCMAGCEFSVDDGTGVLSVQLEGEALDQVLAKGSVGKRVEVTGVFRFSPRPQIAVEKLGSWRLF